MSSKVYTFRIIVFILSLAAISTRKAPYRSLVAAQSIGNFGSIIQGVIVNGSIRTPWQWRNITNNLGSDINGITLADDEHSLTIAFTDRTGVLSADYYSFSIIATGLFNCHFSLILPSGKSMIYTDPLNRIYVVDLVTRQQSILFDNIGETVGVRGLAYDSRNDWLYFSGIQIMRARSNGTQLQNVTRNLNLTYSNPGFQITLDSYWNESNPRVYLAFNGGLYMANGDGTDEKLIHTTPIESNYTGPYGVAVGEDALDGRRYIYWCRGLRSKEAYLERSLLTASGDLTTVETLWVDTPSGEAPWPYALELVPWI